MTFNLSPFDHVLCVLETRHPDVVDLAFLVDRALRETISFGELDQLILDLDHFVATTVDDEDAAKRLAGDTQDLDHPDGPAGAWRQLVVTIRARAKEVRADPSRLPPAPARDDGLTPPRSSAFTDPQLEQRAAEAIRDLYQDEIAELRNKRAGWAAMTFNADLSDSVGLTGEVVIGPESSGGSIAAPAGSSIAVTGATATFWWDRFEREIRRSSCFPDVVLDPHVRAAYPALRHFFGNAFGPVPRRRHPAAVVGLMRDLKNPAFTQVRDELDRLLDIEDDTHLRWVIEQCGSYALPCVVRDWVERLRWRFDAFDWQPDAKGRFA